MTDRTGQTWQEDRKIFVVVGEPANGALWERHPVCYLDDGGTLTKDAAHVDEGGIPWEKQPYMRRIA